MAQELKTSLVIDLAGNLQAQGQRYIDMLRGVGRAGGEAGGALEGGFQRAGVGMNWLINRFTLGAGVLMAAGAAVKQAAQLGENFQRLAGELDVPLAEIERLEAGLNKIAGRRDINIETDSLREAAFQVVELTKDLKYVEGNKENIARALQAAGRGHETEVAQMFIGLQRQGITDPQAIARSLDRSYAQSHLKGAGMLFKDVLGSGAAIASMLPLGRPGEEGVAEAVATLQAAAMGKPGRSGVPGPAHTRMAAMAFFGDLQSARVQQELLAHGIHALDAQGNRRPLAELLPELAAKGVLKSKRNMETIGFSEESQGVLRVWGDELKRTGDIKSLPESMAARGEGGLAEESARLAILAAVKARRALDRIEHAAGEGLVKSVAEVNDAASAVIEGKVGGAVSNFNAALDDLPGVRPAGEAIDRFLDKPVPSLPRMAAPYMPPPGPVDRLLLKALGIGKAEPSPGASPMPHGKITIEVKAAPGTSARVVGRPRAEEMDLDVDSGTIMTGTQ